MLVKVLMLGLVVGHEERGEVKVLAGYQSTNGGSQSDLLVRSNMQGSPLANEVLEFDLNVPIS